MSSDHSDFFSAVSPALPFGLYLYEVTNLDILMLFLLSIMNQPIFTNFQIISVDESETTFPYISLPITEAMAADKAVLVTIEEMAIVE